MFPELKGPILGSPADVLAEERLVGKVAAGLIEGPKQVLQHPDPPMNGPGLLSGMGGPLLY